MSRGGQTPGAGGGGPFHGAPAPGDLVASKYVVERVLGVGGMGIVLAARHVQLGQLVAIKFMRDEAAADSNAVNRFVREARAAAALSSQHVARVLDVGTLESGAPYMVMEYLAGSDVSEILSANGPLNIADGLGIVLQACEAIAEAHEMGIIHRDLKPSNLFVTKRRDGTPLVKVLDFGISKKVDLTTQAPLQNLTVSGVLIGSPLYMSPEQLRSGKDVDARSDIWSLGVIIYELLAGKSPFAGDSLGEVLSRIVADKPPPIRVVRPEIPKGLESVILQCLERDVQRRIQTVGELSAKLAPFASPEGAIAVERIEVAPVVATTPATWPEPEVRTATSGERPAGGRAALRQAVETGPAWLTSDPGQRPARSPSRAKRWAAAAGVVLLIGGAAVVYRFHGVSVGDNPSVAAAPVPLQTNVLPSAAVSPVVTIATTAPAAVLTPLPNSQLAISVPVEREAPDAAATRDAASAVAPVRRRPPTRPSAPHPPSEADLLHDRQ